MSTVTPRRSPRLATRSEQVGVQQQTPAPTLRRSARIAERMARSKPVPSNVVVKTELSKIQQERILVDSIRSILMTYDKTVTDHNTRAKDLTNIYDKIHNPVYEELYLRNPQLRQVIKRKAMELPSQLMTVNVTYWIGKMLKDTCERMLYYLMNLEKNPKCVF